MVATLSVYTFGSADGAERAVRVLEHLQDRGRHVVDDVAVVTWPAGDDRPSAWQERGLAGHDALAGAFWGMLFGIAFLLPLADPTAVSPVDDLLAPVGLGGVFLRRLTEEMRPGRSALFLLARRQPLVRTADALVGPGARLLDARLDERQWANLVSAFASDTRST